MRPSMKPGFAIRMYAQNIRRTFSPQADSEGDNFAFFVWQCHLCRYLFVVASTYLKGVHQFRAQISVMQVCILLKNIPFFCSFRFLILGVRLEYLITLKPLGYLLSLVTLCVRARISSVQEILCHLFNQDNYFD